MNLKILATMAALCLWSVPAPAEGATLHDAAEAGHEAAGAVAVLEAAAVYPVAKERDGSQPLRLAASGSGQSLAEDAGRANRLLVEAIGFLEAADKEPSAEAKITLLEKAYANLTAIVERYPSTDLAVRLATGQRIGNLTLEGVREALTRMRAARRPASGVPGAPVRVWQHRERVVAGAFSANDRRVLTMGRDGIAEVRDLAAGEVVRAWQHRGGIVAAAVSADRRRVLTAGTDGTATVRDFGTGEVVGGWQHDRAVRSVALSPRGRRALAGSTSGALLIDVGAVEVLRTWRDGKPATAVAYSPKRRRVLVGLADGKALLRDPGSGQALHEWKHRGSGGGGVTAAAFSPDGRKVVTAAANRNAELRDVETGRKLYEWRLGDRATSVAYAPDGRWVLTGDEGYEAELHDAATGKTLRKWRYEAPVGAVAFSADGRRVLMGFGDGPCAMSVKANLPAFRPR